MSWQLLKLLGLNSEVAPQDAGQHWTTADNVVFGEGWIEPKPGYARSLTTTVTGSLDISGGIIPGNDWILCYGRVNSNPKWIRRHSGGFHDAIAQGIALTDANSFTVAPSYIVAEDWAVITFAKAEQSVNFGHIPHEHFYRTTLSYSITYATWDSSSHWQNGNRYVTELAQTRNYGFGLHYQVTAGTLKTNSTVNWSQGFGTNPPQWDTSITTIDSGSTPLADTGGPLVTVAPLEDNRALIYKHNAVYVATWQGGQFIWDIRRGNATFGAAGKRCVGQVGSEHIVVTLDDIVRTNGFSYESIARGRILDSFNTDADASDRARTWCIPYSERAELWVFIWTGSAYTKAYVWSWRYDHWSTASGFSFISIARFDRWNNDEAVIAIPQQFTGLSDGTIHFDHYFQGTTHAGTTFTAEAIRSGLDFGHPGRKLARRVRPRLTGDSGALVEISVGFHELDQVDPTWKEVRTFTVGTTQSLERAVNVGGRYLAVRVRSTSASSWKLHDLALDIEPLGGY